MNAPSRRPAQPQDLRGAKPRMAPQKSHKSGSRAPSHRSPMDEAALPGILRHTC
jgi:hypothetical protein